MAEIKGTAGNDELSGSGADTITGLDGNDRIAFSRFGYQAGDKVVLAGGNGDDLITSFITNSSGGALPVADVTISGGLGNDTILVMGAIGRTVNAGAGNDLVLIGVAGTPIDYAVTGASGSTITLGAGADTLAINSFDYKGAVTTVTDFNPDEDRITFDELNVIASISGAATFKGGNAFTNGFLRLVKAGADTKLQYDRDGGGNGFVDVVVFKGVAPSAFSELGGYNVTGGGFTPVNATSVAAGIFRYGDRAQLLTRGGAGNDVLTGTAFTDFLSGGLGDDVINGGAGDDVLEDNFGKNTLNGGSGNDQITSHGSSDRLLGGTGNDVLSYSALSALRRDGTLATLDGGAGDDQLLIANTVAQARLIGGDGNDTIEIKEGMVGHSTINAGAGDDTITVTNGFAAITLGEGADSITVQRDFYTPASQHITIADFVPGTDSVGFAAAAYLDLWDGLSNPFDTGFLAMRQDGGDAVLLLDRSGGGDNLIEFIRFTGLALSELTLADTGGFAFKSAQFVGKAGSDSFTGLVGNDTMSGNGGADTLFGRRGDDTLAGGAGNDTLSGDAGNDTLRGDGGNDVLTGGRGLDLLTGGLGADHFVFATSDTGKTPASADTVTDFSHAEGDLIDLSAIDANQGLSGDQAFTFVGAAAFSAAGQLHAVQRSGATFIEGDTNGDGRADLVIRLDGLHTMIFTDFVL